MRSTLMLLLFLTACGGDAEDGGNTAPDSGERADGGALLADDATAPPPLDGGPPPMDGGPPPPMDGGPPPPGDGGMMMGPRACMETSECTNACPPESVGCACHNTPMGMFCVPTCAQDTDCPDPPPGLMFRCDTMSGICVPF